MGQFKNLSNAVKIDLVEALTTNGTSEVVSASVDMSGYRGVMFLCLLGTAAANNILNAAQSSDDSNFDDIENSGVASGTSEQVWLDIYDPRDRYVRAELTRGTSTTVSEIWAFRYDPRVGPCDNNIAGTIIGELHVGGVEGTK